MSDDMTDAMSDDAQALAGEYVLGTLPSNRRRAVAAALEHDAALRAAVQAWEERLLPLTTLAAPVAPSPQLWQRIDNALALAPVAAGAQPARAPAPAGKWWDSLMLWRALAGGALAAAIMAVVVMPRITSAPAPIMLVVLAAPQSLRPGWIVQSTDARHVRLVPLGQSGPGQSESAQTELANKSANKSLQFWTKADGWKGPVSLGLVTPGQEHTVSLDKLPPIQPNQLFEITLEPASGSPIGRPTGPVLYIGRAVTL